MGKVKYGLAVIIFLGGFLRLYNLAGNPPSMNWDEVSHGFNAYSILTTAKDEWGVTLPLIFRAYGDYKLPVYVYLVALFENIFGLSVWAVRLPSVLAGIGSLVIVYLLAKEIFPNRRQIATLAALLMAITPWGLFLSRPALEGNLAVFLILTGIWLLLRKNGNAGLISLALSLQTYYVARLFVPLFLVGYLWSERQQIKTVATKYRIGLALFLLSLTVVAWQMLGGYGSVRYGLVSLIDQGVVSQIGELRSRVPFRDPFPRIMVNKVTVGGIIFIINYLRHWSPEYLFARGGTNYQFSLPRYGLLYWADLPFLLLGLYVLIRRITHKRGNRWDVLLVWWLVTAPIASALTRDAPHPLRSLIFLPPLVLTIALGMGTFIGTYAKHRNYFRGLTVAVIILVHGGFLFQYWSLYSNEYRTGYSWSWQYGYAQVVKVVKTFYPSVDRIIMTKKYGEPHEFILWYWPWNPKTYAADPNLNRYFLSDWYWVDSFDKFYFVNDWEMKTRENQLVIPGKTLVVTSPGNFTGGSLIERINFLDGTPAFDIIKI